MSTKSIRNIITPTQTHWVGNGFKVYNIIPSLVSWDEISPFVMLDYNAKVPFEPTDNPRGVGVHPHRGFETVTIAYKGAVAHHDSKGNSGVISEGEVQWMTAGSGILHKEYHEKEFAKRGGVFQMVQLWVNLPAKDKMTEPKYQALTKQDIIEIPLEDNAGEIQLIAGTYKEYQGKAFTFSPINLYNIVLKPGTTFTFNQPSVYNTALLCIEGKATISGKDVNENQYVVFDHDGEEITVQAGAGEVALLVMAGEPLNEPIASYGPFIMNTQEELVQAFEDYQAGNFGKLDD